MSAVHYTWLDTPAPFAVAAFSPRGLCALSIGNDRGRLFMEMQRRFSGSELRHAPHLAQAVERRIADLLHGQPCPAPIALDIAGTPFQQRVWQTLMDIPHGTVISYAELARRTGRPRAFRAAANACGANPIALLIPCHRVVATHGLGGFGPGVGLKTKLLDIERKHASAFPAQARRAAANG